MTDDDAPITPEQQKGLLAVLAVFLIFWMAVELMAAAEAWQVVEESHRRWQYVDTVVWLPENCGFVMDQIVCVNTQLR